MNRSELAIIEYAESHSKFTTNEIYAHLIKEIQITKSSLSWYLNQFTANRNLVRIGRGLYSLGGKQMFVPIPSDEVSSVYSYLNEAFPFAHFCIYEGCIISQLQHHLSANNIIYVETDREAVESVFNLLRESGKTTYLKPSKELIYQYIEMSERAYFIKPLITESPLQNIQDVPSPTIEKLLVDIHKDVDFFYLQGTESSHILDNAFNLYTINETKLLRYAGRRGIKEEMKSNIESLSKL